MEEEWWELNSIETIVHLSWLQNRQSTPCPLCASEQSGEICNDHDHKVTTQRTAPISAATKMLSNPVVCHDEVIAVHELCNCSSNILMGDRAVCFDLELAESHFPLLHFLVDHPGDALVPTVARGVLLDVWEPFHWYVVIFDDSVQLVTLV